MIYLLAILKIMLVHEGYEKLTAHLFVFCNESLVILYFNYLF